MTSEPENGRRVSMMLRMPERVPDRSTEGSLMSENERVPTFEPRVNDLLLEIF